MMMDGKPAPTLILTFILSLFFVPGAAALFPGESNRTALPAGELVSGSISHDGVTRTYHVYIPQIYTQKQGRVPVVFALHGHGSDSGLTMRGFLIEPNADREGFIVVYPDGLQPPAEGEPGYQWYWARGWNAGHCCGFAQCTDVDDVGFLASLLLALENEYRIDPSRAYLLGASNGAMLAYRAAAELPGMFAAIAPIHGTLGGLSDSTREYWQSGLPEKPVPSIIFNGLLDETVPYFGNEEYLSAPDSVSYWVSVNGCDSVPEEETSPNGDYRLQTWSCLNAEVRFYSLFFEGHTWPYAPLSSISLTTAQTVSLIWDFFQSYPVRGAPTAPLQFAAASTVMKSWLLTKRINSLTWTENPENADFDIGKYVILFRAGAGEWQLLAEVPPGEFASLENGVKKYSYRHESVSPDVSYEYSVSALTTGLIEGRSASATAE
jgi:polyhydroxybutyrate depolymerase